MNAGIMLFCRWLVPIFTDSMSFADLSDFVAEAASLKVLQSADCFDEDHC
jgi:hypothetical protein